MQVKCVLAQNLTPFIPLFVDLRCTHKSVFFLYLGITPLNPPLQRLPCTHKSVKPLLILARIAHNSRKTPPRLKPPLPEIRGGVIRAKQELGWGSYIWGNLSTCVYTVACKGGKQFPPLPCGNALAKPSRRVARNARGGLGWGNSRNWLNSTTCVYTVGGRRGE
jgi:hypothetical protein